MQKALLPALFLCCSVAWSQVAVTVSVFESYDSNVFLESGDPVVIPADAEIQVGDSLDGDENDDFITYAGLSLSSATTVPNLVELSGQFSGGAFFFAEYDQLNRFSINSNLSAQSVEGLIPFLSVGVTDIITTSGRDAGVTSTSVANSITTHTIALNVGTEDFAISEKASTSLRYTFSRTDNLGDLSFDSSSDEELEAQVAGLGDEGADFFNHVVTSRTDYALSQFSSLDFTLSGSRTNFTSTTSNDLVNNDAADLDRYGLDGRLGGTTQISEQISVTAGAGFSYSRFDEERAPQVVEIINPDGTTSSVLEENDQDQINAIFDAGVNYTPSVNSSVSLFVSQSSGIDVDGDRIVSRSVNLNASSQVGERWIFSGNGQYLQFSTEDSLDNSTDRYELGASARYQVTPYIALSAGYNFAIQEADGGNLDIINRQRDYDVHRAFLNLDVGVVGLADI